MNHSYLSQANRVSICTNDNVFAQTPNFERAETDESIIFCHVLVACGLPSLALIEYERSSQQGDFPAAPEVWE